jgi:hypothetical protein
VRAGHLAGQLSRIVDWSAVRGIFGILHNKWVQKSRPDEKRIRKERKIIRRYIKRKCNS